MEWLAALRREYFQRLEQLGVAARLIVDKTPDNFKWIGVLVAAFPEAKIVHVVRGRCAVLWGIYKQLFIESSFGYSHRLEDIVGYQQLHAKLMLHWQHQHPTRIYTAQYEDLVTNPKKFIPELIDFLGIQWDPACMRFEHTQRAVHTMSSLQVKRKMVRTQSEQWRAYAKHLKPYVKRLNCV